MLSCTDEESQKIMNRYCGDENIELERIIGEKKKEEIISIISKYM